MGISSKVVSWILSRLFSNQHLSMSGALLQVGNSLLPECQSQLSYFALPHSALNAPSLPKRKIFFIYAFFCSTASQVHRKRFSKSQTVAILLSASLAEQKQCWLLARVLGPNILQGLVKEGKSYGLWVADGDTKAWGWASKRWGSLARLGDGSQQCVIALLVRTCSLCYTILLQTCLKLASNSALTLG